MAFVYVSVSASCFPPQLPASQAVLVPRSWAPQTWAQLARLSAHLPQTWTLNLARLGPQVPSPLLAQSRCWISLQEVPTPCCCSLHRGPAPSTSPSSWQPSQVSRLVSNPH